MILSDKIVTALLTLAGGALALALTKFIVEPLNEQRKVTGEVAFALIYWARIYAHPQLARPDDADKARSEIRALAGKIVAATLGVRPYFIGRCLGAPSRGCITSAVEHLVAVSNGVYVQDAGTKNCDRANKALAYLRVKITV